MEYIERAREKSVLEASEYFKVVLVTGPRQVGKTTMLMRLADSEGASRGYVSLDATGEIETAREDPALFLQRHPAPVIIDEIQNAPELLPYIKADVDARPGEHGLYWLTGSRPFALMKGVSESLAGRVAIIELLGLSLSEIDGRPSRPFMPSDDLMAQPLPEQGRRSLAEVFAEIHKGSFPEMRKMPPSMAGAALDAYLDTYVMRDIRSYQSILDEVAFKRFVAACAALTATAVNYSELARIAGISEKTAKAWLGVLEASYLVKVVPPYSNNLIKRLAKQPVMHFVDTGLAARLTQWGTPGELEAGAYSGRIFETYAFMEVYKSLLNAGATTNGVYFFKTNDRQEIDLIIDRDGILHPIEVKKKAEPRRGDVSSFGVLGKLEGEDIPDELAAFRREIGTGAVVCMAQEAYPITRTSWAYPVWAI